jgi:hypothetical protein
LTTQIQFSKWIDNPITIQQLSEKKSTTTNIEVYILLVNHDIPKGDLPIDSQFNRKKTKHFYENYGSKQLGLSKY